MRITAVVFSLAVALAPFASRLATAGEQRSAAELQARQRRIEKRMLRLQQERFESQMRGDAQEATDRLARQLGHTQSRHREITQALHEQP